MQKHNKYLVITIWIATIAFIGAGFVGWGSYQYGSKAGSIAKVGDIEITKPDFDMAYSDLYQRYNQMMQGRLDEKKAREMGLAKQAFSSLAAQALLLNLANEFGIIVTDKELAEKLANVSAFQTNGTFDKALYEGYLKSRHIKAKTFEETIHNETVIQKLFSLLGSKSLPFEREIVTAAINISDKIAYKVLTADDLNLTFDEKSVKQYWEAHKGEYQTPRKYKLDILWTESRETNASEKELEEFYNRNSFNYISDDGKQLSLKEAREKVLGDLKMKKTKKHAQKQYIAYKKGKIEKSESVTLPSNDALLTAEVWKEIETHDTGTIMKPKAVKDRYATIKISAIVDPREMHFEEAKSLAAADYRKNAVTEGLSKLADKTLENFDPHQATVSDFVTLESRSPLKPLNIQESLQFLQKIFTSQKEKGIISLKSAVVVYKIVDQKLVTNKKDSDNLFAAKSADQIKAEDFQNNLLKSLGKRYSIEKFVEGI